MGLILAGGISRQSANAQQPSQTDSAQPADVLPPDIEANSSLAEIIRLSQAEVSEDVIKNYINNSQYRFSLTANQIIYLKDIGLPDSIVMAMQQRDQQLGLAVSPPPPQAAPAPPPATTVVTENYFYDSLAPYGSWVVIEGYGRCWRPSVVVYDSSWQPYSDHGHWVYTDDGWYWYSDYSWGWAPFHYGRWFRNERFGWCWYPDTVWAPSWVCWRYSDDYCGWAPLPPRCEYREGVGLFFNGAVVSVGFDFGFSANTFVFVSTRNFYDPHPWRHRVASTQVTQIFNQTTVINNFGGNNTTVINHGIPPEHIAAVTHTPIHPARIRETTTPVGRGEQMDRSGALVVNRPHFDHNASPTANDNRPHTIPSPTTGAPMQIPPPNQSNSPRRNQTTTQNRNVSQPAGISQPAANDNGNSLRRNQPNNFGSTSPRLPETPQPRMENQSQMENRTVPQNRLPNNPNEEQRTTSPRMQQPERQFSPPANENRVQPSQRNYNAQPTPQPHNPPSSVQPREPQPQQSQPSQQSTPSDRQDRNRDKDKNGQ